MNELKASLQIALANTFVMYFKAHSFHWNVEGIHFTQYHSFFNSLYDDLYSAVDPLAEELRGLDTYAPTSLNDLYGKATLTENSILVGDNVRQMLNSLLTDNEEVIDSLNKVFELANKENEQGICNLVADRLDTHKKHGWQLRASLKGQQ